jgi:hypothetical protein
MLPPLPGAVVPFSLDFAVAIVDLTLGLILGLIGLWGARSRIDRVLRRRRGVPPELRATREHHG